MATKKKVVTKKIDVVKDGDGNPIEEVMPSKDYMLQSEVEFKADLIRSQFAEINNVEGVPFDASNPDHLLIAAFTVGARGLLRR